MNTLKLICQAALILSLSAVALADPYALGWEDVNASEAAKPTTNYTLGWEEVQSDARAPEPSQQVQEDVVEPPEVVNLAELPGKFIAAHAPPSGRRVLLKNFAPESSLEETPEVPTFDIELSSYQAFDHTNDRYRQVETVEVVTYRGGYPECELFENVGEYREYDVTLEDLKPGDRYEVKVTWDDGSYRCLETTVDRYPEQDVIINEPLTLGCRL